jgi:protein-S-isoprenylcysteine O-methyltransferase Ste14
MSMSRLFVWSGGALFVASLALCARWYLVVLATAGLRFDPGAIVFDGLAFTVFASHHSIFARERVRAAIARAVPERLLRSVYVWTASLLLMLVVLVWRPVGGDLYHVTGSPALLFAAVQLAGLGLIARAVKTIDPLELAGIRHYETRDALQIAGPYRWVRHPLYLGWVIAVFGTAHLTGDRLAFAAITTIYLALAVPWEERSLLKSFGEDYRRYQQRVRWRIVPYLY